jgi:hypothetical protein
VLCSQQPAHLHLNTLSGVRAAAAPYGIVCTQLLQHAQPSAWMSHQVQASTSTSSTSAEKAKAKSKPKSADTMAERVIQRTITLKPQKKGIYLMTRKLYEEVPELKQVQVGSCNLFLRVSERSVHPHPSLPDVSVAAVRRCTAMKQLRIVTVLISGGGSLTSCFATPAYFPLQHCSPYPHVHVRCESLGFVPRSRAIFCRPAPNPNITIRNFFVAVWHGCCQHQ